MSGTVAAGILALIEFIERRVAAAELGGEPIPAEVLEAKLALAAIINEDIQGTE